MAETVNAYRADPYDYAEARALAEALGLSEPVAITLVRRGYRTPEDARAFLEADETHPPDDFSSMAAVVEQVRAAIEAGKRITVHGDFDVDGVCATTIMVATLRELGAECDWLIPDRLADGYGLDAENIRRLAERGTSLLITVDCGITAVEEVALAKSLGIDVIVTDHHQPAGELPDCPILHPEIDGYPFTDLCGTAVAWKLSSALRDDAGRDLDLVALATVADVVPLVGENRSIVRRGLEEIRRAERPGIRALLAAAKVEPTQLDEGDLAFRLAPRINAAGRLYRADAGVELFLTEDPERAAEIATELSRANGERRATEQEVSTAAEAARRELPEHLRDAPALVVAGEGWHPGVVGIVASRLAERHHRPAIVISLDGEGGGRGSGRSIPGFDLLAGLEACASHLTSFGGHRAAAGLELPADAVDGFREAFCAHAATVLGPDDLVRTVEIDAMIGGAGLGLDLAEELERLAPFGMGNPGVRLLVPSARVEDVRAMGEEGKHSRFSLRSGSHRALGVAFGRSGLGVEEGDPIDAAVRLEVNRWKGSVEPRVVLRELYPHPGQADPDRQSAEWWQRFEAELQVDPHAVVAARDRARGGPGAGRVDDRQLRRGDGRRARLERGWRGPRRGRRHRAAGAPRPRGSSPRRRLHPRIRARAGARVRARRPRRPAGLRAGLAPVRAPRSGSGLSPRRLGGVRARVLHLGPRPAPGPPAGADLGLQVAARGRRLQRRAAARSPRRAWDRGAPPGGGGALLPGSDRARVGAGDARRRRRHGRGRILR